MNFISEKILRNAKEYLRYLRSKVICLHFQFQTKIPREDMIAMMEYGKNLVPMDLLKAKDEIRQNKSGSVVLYVDEDDPVCAWVRKLLIL